MDKPKRDWIHAILEFLHTNYTAYNVPIHSFLTNELKIKINDGNSGRKIYDTLKELEIKKLIELETTDHNLKEVNLNIIPKDNTSITLDKYWFHVKLTFDGLVYIGNYLRLEEQANSSLLTDNSIRNVNKLFIATVIIALLGAVAQIKGCQTSTDQLKLQKEQKHKEEANQQMQYQLNMQSHLVEQQQNLIDSLQNALLFSNCHSLIKETQSVNK